MQPCPLCYTRHVGSPRKSIYAITYSTLAHAEVVKTNKNDKVKLEMGDDQLTVGFQGLGGNRKNDYKSNSAVDHFFMDFVTCGYRRLKSSRPRASNKSVKL